MIFPQRHPGTQKYKRYCFVSLTLKAKVVMSNKYYVHTRALLYFRPKTKLITVISMKIGPVPDLQELPF